MENQQKKHNRPAPQKRLKIEIKKLSENAFLPVRAKKGSIGYDLSIPEDVTIPAYSRTVIPLHLAINLPYGVEGKIEPRSGFSSKGMEGYGKKIYPKNIFGLIKWEKEITGLHRYNADVLPGKIDPLYTDSIGVIICNNDREFVLRRGTRIAQITFYSTLSPKFVFVDELSCDSRGGGFGSSGSCAQSVTEETKVLPSPAGAVAENLKKVASVAASLGKPSLNN